MKYIVVVLVSLLFMVQCATITLLCSTLETMLETEIALIGDYEKVTKELHEHQRLLERYQNRIEKLELQLDLVVAASRSGWGEAYRLMRAGFPEEVQ